MSLILDTRRIAAPTFEPVSLDEAKLHLRVDHADEDAAIDALIVTARNEVERVGWLSVCSQSWRLHLTGWPDAPVILPRHPIQSITSVKWYDSSDTQQTLASTTYALVPDAGCDARLYLAGGGQAWPTAELSDRQYPIVVEYVAGWTADTIPAAIKHYMLMLIGSLYEHRESTVMVPGVSMAIEMPFVDGLIDEYRGFRY